MTRDTPPSMLDDAVARPTAIDLFCGAGGLTHGLLAAGFSVVAGVERDRRMRETYEHNNPGAKCVVADITKISGTKLLHRAGVKTVDLVVGCPPCQGFSKLTDKCRKADPRNGLVLEMARMIEELRPRVVMMENVAGLAHRGLPVLEAFISRLEAMGYKVNWDVLQIANYGVAQSRRRLVLLAGLGFEIALPSPTHAPKHKVATSRLPAWRRTSDIIGGLPKPVTLVESRRKGGPQKHKWHVVRDVRAITLERLRKARAGRSRTSIPAKLRPTCHVNVDEGFTNVYSRMRWSQTPPTITAGCTKFCTGRFGHPTQLRTISVREAALIQGFPAEYEFLTDEMELVCTMVGNALPPPFAECVARKSLQPLFARRPAT